MIECRRCAVPMAFAGTKRFHEGTNWGWVGELGEFFVKKERFDVYSCPNCGSVELFIDGVGEELRSENPAF